MESPNQLPVLCLPDGFILRALCETDAAALFPTLSDEENGRFSVYEPHKSVRETARWIKRKIKTPFWAIVSPNGTAVGFVGYHTFSPDGKSCMVAYHLNKEYWGKGIVPAAVLLTDIYLFENTDIERISATVKPENSQSQRCLQKAGYILERIIDDYVSPAANDCSRIRCYYNKCK